MKDVWSRAGVSLGLLLSALAVSRVQLPLFRLDALGGEVVDVEMFSALSLGFDSYFTAAIAVEIVALVVPRWRALRESDDGRTKLSRASMALATSLFAVQAWAFVDFASKIPVISGMPAQLATGALLVVSPMLFLVVARKLDGRAFAGSMPWLFAAELVIKSRDGQAVLDALSVYGALPIALLVAACVMLFIGLRLPPLVHEKHAPMPMLGTLPLSWSITAVLFLADAGVVDTGGLRSLAPGTLDAWIGAGVVAMTFAFGAALYTSRPTLAAWKHGNDEHRLVAACALGIARSLLPLGLAVLAQSQTRSLVLASALAPSAFALALALDVAHELRARRLRDDWTRAWTVARVLEADALRAALEAEGFDVLVRGRSVRCLMHFFAPYFPIELHVPDEDRDEACAFIDTWLNEARASR